MASSYGGSKKPWSADASSSDTNVNAVSEGLPNLNMTGGEDFKRLLECPICMEILDSPIYQCPGGHTICNTCKPKLTKCPSCEVPVGIIRNLVLESILQTVSFSCNHHHKGCNEVFKIQDLQEHHEECEFRPLKCHLSDMDDCNGTLLYLADTLRHLQDTHKLRTVKSMRGHPNTFQCETDKNLCALTWPGGLFHFDQNNFVALIRKCAKTRLNYFGFYFIGSKSDASKYSVKITFESPEAVLKQEITTRFTSIRSFQEEWEENKLPEELVVHPAVARRETIISTIGTNPKWDITYQINKI